MKILIISGSSDIGQAFIKKFNKSNKIYYTYNKTKIKNKNTKGIYLDIANKNQIDKFVKNKNIHRWDLIIFLTGLLDPIGRFDEVNPKKWQKSLEINFSNQIYLLQKLIPFRNINIKKLDFPTVVFTAGPATNSANKYYSSYTISKISLIKIVELLDFEFEDIKFIIIGPGMIKTKIHMQTLSKPHFSRENYINVINRIKNKQYNSLKEFILCIDYLIHLPKNIIGGRNISFEFDKWQTKKFIKLLNDDSNKFKLRRKE